MHPIHNHRLQPSGEGITVRGPAALAAALPYLIDTPLPGSIILAVINGNSSLGLTAYKALADYPSGASPEVQRHWASDVGRLAVEGLRSCSAGPGEYLALVIYLPSALGRPPSWFTPLLRSQGLLPAPHVLDIMLVFGDRWRSVVCDNEACCPADGAVIMENSDAALVAAELVAAGLTPGGSAVPAARVAEVGALLDAMPYPRNVKARRRLLHRVWPLILQPPAVLDDQMAVLLAMAADRPGVRDAILTRLARLDDDPQRWQQQFDLWAGVAVAVPDRWLAGPACMVAIAAWCMGEDGAAEVAVGHAMAVEPGHRMGNLIKQMLDKQLPSSVWFERMRGIDEADCLRFDRPPAAERRGPEAKAAG